MHKSVLPIVYGEVAIKIQPLHPSLDIRQLNKRDSSPPVAL